MLPQKTQQVCWMGYGEEDDSTIIEIVYEYNREKIDRGDGYGQVHVPMCLERYIGAWHVYRMLAVCTVVHRVGCLSPDAV